MGAETNPGYFHQLLFFATLPAFCCALAGGSSWEATQATSSVLVMPTFIRARALGALGDGREAVSSQNVLPGAILGQAHFQRFACCSPQKP